MGWSGLHRSAGETNVTLPSVDQTATLTTPSVSAPNLNTPTGSLPGLSFAPLSIVRSGNGFTLTGDLPDLNAKNALLDTLRGTIGADVNLTDNLNIKAGVSAPDFTGLGGLFKAAVDIPDFNFDLNGDTLTLTGTAPSEDAKSAVEAAEGGLAEHQDSQQHSGIAGAPTANHTGTGNWVVCQLAGRHLRSNRDADQLPDRWLQLTAGSQSQLTQVADKLKACPNAKVAVVGHTDNTGNDAINIPLSGNRAKSVADYLISQGVPAGSIASSGVGSAQPIASGESFLQRDDRGGVVPRCGDRREGGLRPMGQWQVAARRELGRA